MAQNPDPLARATDESSYRCPGCGKIVDSRRIEQVLQHHRHVLEQQYPPAWFNVTTRPQRTTNASTKVVQAERDAPSPTRNGDSAELQRRRYGH